MRKLIAMAFIMLLFVGIGSADTLTTYEGTSTTDFWGDDSNYSVDRFTYDISNERFICVDSTNNEVYEFTPSYPPSTTSTSLMIDNSTLTCIDVGSDGTIYVGDSSGYIYSLNDFNGIIDMADTEGDFATYFNQAAYLGSGALDLVVDANDNIYVACVDEYVYKISAPYYVKTTLSGYSGVDTSDHLRYLGLYEDGITLGYSITGTHQWTIEEYNLDTYTVDRQELFGTSGIGYGGLPHIYLSDSNYISSYNKLSGSGSDTYIKFYNESADSETTLALYFATSYSTTPYAWTDINMDSNGLIYASRYHGGFDVFITDESNFPIESYAHLIYEGGGSAGTDIDLSLIEYFETAVVSEFDTYVNNTDVGVQYAVWTGNMTASEKEDFKDTYDYRIELEDPDGVLVGTKNIDGASFEEFEFDLLYATNPTIYNWFISEVLNWSVGEYFFKKTGSFTFTNNGNWDNGTYSLTLYELNSVTGTKYSIAVDTFEVLNQSYEFDIGIGASADETTQGGDLTGDSLIHSTIFKAACIILIPAIALGLVLDIAGAAIGLVLGLIMAFALGLISIAWIVLLAFAIVAVFAAFLRDLITGKN